MLIMAGAGLSDNTTADSGIGQMLTSSITLLVIIVSTVLLLTSSWLGWRWLSGRKRATKILLTGICNSGKTALFFKLRGDYPSGDSGMPRTLTSMKENVGVFRVSPNLVSADGNDERAQRIAGMTKLMHVVDLPGHDRLRPKLAENLPEAVAIVMLVNSAEITNELTQVAGYLYSILTSSVVVRRQIPVLVACNKADLPTAIKASKIQQYLEKELDRLRVTRTTNVNEDLTKKTDSVFLGFEGEKFVFDHAPTSVEFIECSVKTGDNLESIAQFMQDHAK